jgi:hypothetical protein
VEEAVTGKVRKTGTDTTTITVADTSQSKILPIRFYKQLADNWCWAACCQMFLRYRKKSDPIRQCHMATALNAAGDQCCGNVLSAACDSPQTPQNAFQKYGVTFVPVAGAQSLAQVQAEINQGRPVEIHYQWLGFGAHVVMVVGFYDDGTVEVFDPLDTLASQHRRAFSSVASAYSQGFWVATYKGLT